MKLQKFTIAAAVLALSATPAALATGKPEDPGSQGKSAQAKGKKKPRNYVVKGTVTAVPVAPAITPLKVNVRSSKGKGKGKARQPKGEITVVLTATTKLNVADTNHDNEMTVADIAVGDRVVVQLRYDGTTYTARKVVDQTRPKPSDD